jgi:transcriptional regulator with XRE-family HTH domain
MANLMVDAPPQREGSFSERSRHFLAWLRPAMDRVGLNQSQVAKYMGTQPSTVSGWFTRGAIPRYELCYPLAKVLRVSAREAFEAAGYEPPADLPETETTLPPWVVSALEQLNESGLMVVKTVADSLLREQPELYSAELEPRSQAPREEPPAPAGQRRQGRRTP